MPRSRTRAQLLAFLPPLVTPHTKVGEVYLTQVLHDDWCTLSRPTATLASKCRCNPTVTLERMGDQGEVLEAIPILEDGRPVIYGN